MRFALNSTTLLATLILCGSLGWSGQKEAAPPGEQAGKLAPLLENLGSYRMRVSNCSRTAKAFFDQGLRLFYGFYFPEAIASFREAARLDPDCPMIYWGVALAIAPGPNSRYLGFPDDPQGKGAEAIDRAIALINRASEKEARFIRALHILYDVRAQPDARRRGLAYAEAMREVLARYPADPEAGTLYAAARMTLSPWNYWTPDGKPRPGTEEVDAALQRVMRAYPVHPGANHLYTHLMESSQNPERALPHAERLARAMPGAGHLLHMPSHLYLRTGRYAQVVESNRRSIAADKALLDAWGEREMPMGVGSYSLSARVHGMHAHEFIHMATVFQGSYSASIDAARAAAVMIRPEQLRTNGTLQRHFVRPWLTQRQFGKWQQILDEPPPTVDLPFIRGTWHFARGSALAATDKLPEAERELAEVRAAAARKETASLMVRVNPASKVLALSGHLLEGEIAARRGEIERAIAHLETAQRLEDGLAYMEPPDWAYPVRHSLGAVLLQAGRVEEAEVVYWEDLRRNPENGWSLYGVRQSLLRQGDTALAAEVEDRFKKAWAHADVTLTGSRF
jgi:tetratricopeptide (TPR) repeat protein